MQRRRFITTVGAVAIGLQAGCLADGQRLAGTDSPSPGRSPTDTVAQPRIEDHRIKTLGTGCKSKEVPGIDATFTESSVAIEGIAQTPTPCYVAALESATVRDGELQLKIGFDEDDSDLCTECVGALAYEATIELDTTAGVDTVVVTHLSSGEQFTATRDG